jgi:hypothetical protein
MLDVVGDAGIGRFPEGSGLTQRDRLLFARLRPHNAADLAQVEFLGEGRPRRNRKEREEASQLVRHGGQELPIPAQHVGRVVEVVQHRAGEHGREGMAAKRERRHDPEITAAAAEPPEEVRLAGRVRLNDRPVSEHMFDDDTNGKATCVGDVPVTHCGKVWPPKALRSGTKEVTPAP